MYVYIQSEPQLWTVGHYTPLGKWVPESDHGCPQEAAARVAYLNGRETGQHCDGISTEALEAGIIKELLKALRLYIKLDSDFRAGCEITDEDWAECYQAATEAIAKAEGKEHKHGRQE